MANRVVRWVLLLLISFAGAACGHGLTVRTTSSPEMNAGPVHLPDPSLSGPVPLERAIAGRQSVRQFTGEPLTAAEISQLLWSAQGISRGWGGRTAPSAGALYPLELYVATPDGFYHYIPDGHLMDTLSREDLRPAIWRASLRQSSIRQAPAVFVFTAVYERTAAKYGDRAERYVLLEAGHAAQNLLLQAVALDLTAVPIGAFYDDQLSEGLSLPADEAPLYVIPVGHQEGG